MLTQGCARSHVHPVPAHVVQQAHEVMAEIGDKSLPSPTPKGKRPALRQHEGPQQNGQVQSQACCDCYGRVLLCPYQPACLQVIVISQAACVSCNDLPLVRQACRLDLDFVGMFDTGGKDGCEHSPQRRSLQSAKGQRSSTPEHSQDTTDIHRKCNITPTPHFYRQYYTVAVS